MSLASNISNVAYATLYPVDKIVRVFQGSFAPGSLTPINGLGTPLAYVFSHGFNRPVFTQLISSSDNVTYTDGGLKDIAYSDSSNITILTNQVAGTVYYKILVSWIDDYDGTNPSVTPTLNYQKNVIFDSRVNYQKIFQQAEISMAQNTTQTITHSRGSTPDAKVYFEAFPGQVWPANSGGTGNQFLYDLVNQVELYFVSKTNTLDITTQGGSATARRTWYRIYV